MVRGEEALRNFTLTVDINRDSLNFSHSGQFFPLSNTNSHTVLSLVALAP
jgi:hypothetical protein